MSAETNAIRIDLSPHGETMDRAILSLHDGTILTGEPFGAYRSIAGEVVFNTGMVGYPEAMTDPSYYGQILVFTYPLIGNYGIPAEIKPHSQPELELLQSRFESNFIRVSAIVVSNPAHSFNHWEAAKSLDTWMREQNIPGISCIDTRALTKRLRTKGCMLGKLIVGSGDIPWYDPNERNLAAEISIEEPVSYRANTSTDVIVVVDLGCKHNIVRCLLKRGVNVRVVPWNYDWSDDDVQGVVISNGPGDPKVYREAIDVLSRGMQRDVPILGICLGHQLLALAAGGDTYKMKFGHRSQNQPCIEHGTNRCFITSQNHGYAVSEESLDISEWEQWFTNANDATNEGIRHRHKPIFSVQFHPEASPGPVDTEFVFDLFLHHINDARKHQESVAAG
jgi:carbamoyl-phosphate synthase small subunit